MNLIQVALVILVFLVNLMFTQPSWADRPKLTSSPEYTEVTEAITNLLKAKKSPTESDYTPAEIEQKIGELQLQKYILETAKTWGTCQNETGQTLAVYAHKPQKSFFPNMKESQLFYLGDGQVTDDEWSCDGVYLPSGAKVTGLVSGNTQDQELTEPIALKIVSGTQLVATTNRETGTLELNVPPAQIFKVGEGNWSIPTLSQADIAAKTPNAPIDD